MSIGGTLEVCDVLASFPGLHCKWRHGVSRDTASLNVPALTSFLPLLQQDAEARGQKAPHCSRRSGFPSVLMSIVGSSGPLHKIGIKGQDRRGSGQILSRAWKGSPSDLAEGWGKACIFTNKSTVQILAQLDKVN